MKKIVENEDEDSGSFSDLKTDKHTIQLFYKMKLSRMPYHYHNIIRAFEIYGIDCEEMSIDEYKLILWDVEMVYAIYNMKKSIQDDLKNEILYEEQKRFNYDDFKVNKSEHSDTFNYDGWNRWFEENTPVEKINDSLDEDIMAFYTKFSLNFRENID